MPSNLNALSRYRIIDRCLSDRLKKYWSYQELNARLEEHDIIVRKRTFEKDLETMRFDTRLAFYAPIVYCKVNQAYHYSEKNYSLYKPVLKESEVKILQSIMAMMKDREGGEVQAFGRMIERLG